jgi:hypothetical protein
MSAGRPLGQGVCPSLVKLSGPVLLCPSRTGAMLWNKQIKHLHQILSATHCTLYNVQCTLDCLLDRLKGSGNSTIAVKYLKVVNKLCCRHNKTDEDPLLVRKKPLSYCIVYKFIRCSLFLLRNLLRWEEGGA